MSALDDDHVDLEIARLEAAASAEAEPWGEPTGAETVEVGFPGPQNELVDLGAVLARVRAEGWDGEEPVVGRVPGYAPNLLYRGMNAVAGGSSSAKTLFSQILTAQVLRAGLVAVALDVETGRRPEGYAHRLGALGATEEDLRERLVYVNWRNGMFPHELVTAGLRGRRADLVIVDSVPEAMSAFGLDENAGRDVIGWHSELSDALLMTTGPDAAVLLIDGLPKGWAPGQDVRGGVGSVRKLYAVESYWRMYARSPKGSKTVDGFSELVCTKDRWGTHQEGTTVADVFYGPSGFGLRAPTRDPTIDYESVRADVLAFIEKSGPPGLDNPTRSEIKEACGAGWDVALDMLVDVGEVVKHEPSNGRVGRNSIRYYAARFAPDDEDDSDE